MKIDISTVGQLLKAVVLLCEEIASLQKQGKATAEPATPDEAPKLSGDSL